MRLAALGLALLLSGCSTTVEGGLRLCPYNPGEMRDLERDFVALWRVAELPEPLRVERAIREVNVECHETVIVGGLGVVYGVTHSPWDVEIATLDPGSGVPLTLRQSALAHEYVHVALWNVTGDPDVTHAAEEGPWTPVHDALILALRQSR